jgi:hypothetical protein
MAGEEEQLRKGVIEQRHEVHELPQTAQGLRQFFNPLV